MITAGNTNNNYLRGSALEKAHFTHSARRVHAVDVSTLLNRDLVELPSSNLHNIDIVERTHRDALVPGDGINSNSIYSAADLPVSGQWGV